MDEKPNETPEQVEDKKPDGEEKPKEKEVETISPEKYQEIIAERDEYKNKLTEKENAEEGLRQKELEEQGKYQELLAEKEKELEAMPTLKKQMEDYETSLSEMLEVEMKAIPEDKKSLIPDELPTLAKMKYIAKNRELLLGKSSTGAGISPNEKSLGTLETKRQRYNALMDTQKKGEILTEAESLELMKLGSEITHLQNEKNLNS